MTEKNPPCRPLGYARVSTYGQTLDAPQSPHATVDARTAWQETALSLLAWAEATVRLADGRQANGR